MALRRSLQPLLTRLNPHLTGELQHAGRLFSSKADEQQQQQQEQQQKVEQPTTTATTAAASAQSTSTPDSTTTTAAATRPPKAEEEWEEVVDEKSGQTYYWNQKTGETTDLGEPRPKTRFRDQEWEQAANSGPFQEGWREPPGRDHTYFYSVVGVGIGIAAGWFTQYLH